MLRTPLIVTAAGAALALLTACGSVQMGAAATTSGNGIPTATLRSEVQNLNQAVQAGKGRIQLQFPASRMPQQVLSWLIRFRVRDEMAAHRGITVTRAQSQQALAQAQAQARQSGTTLTNLAVANGLPPDLLPAFGRFQAIQNQLVNQLDGGKLPTSQAAQQTLGKQFTLIQCRAAKSLDIKVNPQYGQLNFTQLTVVPGATALSAPQGQQASQAPQPGPSC